MKWKMNRELLAPCGLYCGVCGVFAAGRDNNQKLKKLFARMYGVTSEQISCNGCLSKEKFVYCQKCDIRSCIIEKQFTGCHQCDEFPCVIIDNFPIPAGKKVILRSVLDRKRLGTEQWVEEEEKKYRCPHCNNYLYRGLNRCGNCRLKVNTITGSW